MSGRTTDPQEFRTQWNSEVVAKLEDEDTKLVCAPASPYLERLPVATRAFLREVGLPESAAPCLTFTEVGKGLARLWEVYSPKPEWKPEEKKPVETCLMLGSDGAGSPICIDERDGTIVLLDHELPFDAKRLLKRITFINSSVSQLAECLLEYNANLESPSLDKVREIDAAAASPNTFWFMEVNAVTRQTKPWWKFW